jgi:hypothetical protein
MSGFSDMGTYTSSQFLPLLVLRRRSFTPLCVLRRHPERSEGSPHFVFAVAVLHCHPAKKSTTDYADQNESAFVSHPR